MNGYGLRVQGRDIETLLFNDTITCRGNTPYPNPLGRDNPDGKIRIIEAFLEYSILEQTIQVHGDLQQTNQYMTSDGESEKLVGLDYRPMDIVPSHAEIYKMLWGPEFVPGMEDMWDVILDDDNQIIMTPKVDRQHCIANFAKFSESLHEKAEQHKLISAIIEKDPDAKPLIYLAIANQYIRDLRIVLPRLKNSGSSEEIAYLERRFLFDLLQAAKHFQNYQELITSSEKL